AAVLAVTIPCAVWLAPPAFAQDAGKERQPEPTPPPATEGKTAPEEKKAPAPPPKPVEASPDDVTQQLQQAKRKEAGFIERGPISLLGSRWLEFTQKLDESIGLDLGLAYTIVYQRATEARDDRNAAGADFDFFGTWRLIGDEEGGNVGKLGFVTETRHSYTSIPPAELALNIGSLWKTTDGFDTQKFSLIQLWWDQHLFNDHLQARVGKIDQGNLINTNRLKSDDLFFLNQAFSGNPALAFPGTGLGAAISLVPADLLYILATFSDANGDRETAGFDTFFDDAEYFTAVEVGLRPLFEKLWRGHYRFTFWHIDEREKAGVPSGKGFALSFDQEVTQSLMALLRYGYGDDGGLEVRHILSGGVTVNDPFGSTDDLLGVAAAWGEPQDSSLRNQYTVEAFYRVQLTPNIQLTPGYQLIINPSENRDDDVIGVFEIRLRLFF
ncbi:MAG: carbohydrate porin, partial [Candidatus Methylomirabilales bacterium]